MNSFPLLTVLTATPFVGATVLLILAPKVNQGMARGLALAFSLLAAVFAIVLWATVLIRIRPIVSNSSNNISGFLHLARSIPTGYDYYVAVDGLGLLMVLLAAIVTPIAILSSWRIENRPAIYFAMVLLLQAGLFGTFAGAQLFSLVYFLGVEPDSGVFPDQTLG